MHVVSSTAAHHHQQYYQPSLQQQQAIPSELYTTTSYNQMMTHSHVLTSVPEEDEEDYNPYQTHCFRNQSDRVINPHPPSHDPYYSQYHFDGSTHVVSTNVTPARQFKVSHCENMTYEHHNLVPPPHNSYETEAMLPPQTALPPLSPAHTCYQAIPAATTCGSPLYNCSGVQSMRDNVQSPLLSERCLSPSSSVVALQQFATSTPEQQQQQPATKLYKEMTLTETQEIINDIDRLIDSDSRQ